MITVERETKVIIPRVRTFGPKPKNPQDALIQARELLRQEGQWAKGHFFQDGDAQEAYDSAACGSWTACAMGAVGLVTGEMPISVSRITHRPDKWSWRDAVMANRTEKSLKAFQNDPANHIHSYQWDVPGDFDTQGLSRRVGEYLAAAITKKYDPAYDSDGSEAASIVYEFNDPHDRKRGDVLRAFSKAIKLAEGDPFRKIKRNS